MRPLFTTKGTPAFYYSSGYKEPFTLMNIPIWLKMTDSTMDEFPIDKTFIRMNDPDDQALIDEIVTALGVAIADPDVTVED